MYTQNTYSLYCLELWTQLIPTAITPKCFGCFGYLFVNVQNVYNILDAEIAVLDVNGNLGWCLNTIAAVLMNSYDVGYKIFVITWAELSLSQMLGLLSATVLYSRLRHFPAFPLTAR